MRFPTKGGDKLFQTPHFLHVCSGNNCFVRALLQNGEDPLGVGSTAVCSFEVYGCHPFQLLPVLCNYMLNSQAVIISALLPKTAVWKF